MSDSRKHRGPHPEDRRLFGEDQIPALREATRDLSWLLSRDYASSSSLKIVGNRYQLDARQRIAVARCACPAAAAANRQRRSAASEELRNAELWLDGYNVITSLEAALGGAVILAARDGCFRDMASMHGSYRKVEETIPVLHLLGELLQSWSVSNCRWWLDAPVSNSGRLKTILLELSRERGWNWSVDLVPDPDAVLSTADQIVATSDSVILDRAGRWLNLARLAIERRVPSAWIVDLSS